MSTYYSNHDLDAYAGQLGDFNHAVQVWDESKALADSNHDQAMVTYQEAHDQWEVNGGIDPTTEQPYPEPLPPADPVYPPEPQPPAEPSTVYNSREVTELEEIVTATGPTVIAPGRVVLSPDGGTTEFALSEAELDAGYTPTTAPLPVGKERPR
jgi:hypothetical protein